MPASAISGLVLLCLSVAYWFGADAIPKSALSGSVGADGMPKMLAMVLAGLSVVLIFQSLAMRRSSAAASEELDLEEGEGPTTARGHLLAVGVLVIGVVYALILPYAGYVVSMALLLLAVALFYGRRPGLGLAAFSVIGAGVFYLIFVTLLRVRMPDGMWPSLFS